MGDRIKYICCYCNYKFIRNNGITFRYCPYCGRTGTVQEDKHDRASRLLEESNDFQNIF
ncbi:hypothetical protein JW930_07035 [Candidatus Woesearchaeota archaeon]|nr:hypothetical protein [Candidatus Woesearchaeota archaeon]